MRKFPLITFLFWSSLFFGQATLDSIPLLTKELDEVVVVDKQQSSLLELRSNKSLIDMSAIKHIPKVLGTSDPVRYLQSLSGIQTNNETTSGIHVQGCDDYQTMVSINGAPVYYPNHLLGLFSTFISSHFQRMTVEQAEHRGTMENRIGGLINLETKHFQPKKFELEGNIGLINSDLTLTIPCGKKTALYLSGRGSYINALYGKFLKVDEMNIGYYFLDTNLTYAIQATEKDEIVLSGFFSRDKIGLTDSGGTAFGVGIKWHNMVGSLYWNRQLQGGNYRATLSYSGFNNVIDIENVFADVDTEALWSSVDFKNRLNKRLKDNMFLSSSIDFTHYYTKPLNFLHSGLDFIKQSEPKLPQHAEEFAIGADLQHRLGWFSYNVGLHGSLFYNKHCFGACDPRLSFHFYPAGGHEISLHGGCYTQFFHKAGLTGGGLPTDFFLLADKKNAPERAVGTNLRYTATLLNGMLSFQMEGYFKQIYGVVESLGNILQLINQGFNYDEYLINGDGRNYGLNLTIQKNKGIISGHVSYSLGYATRKFPDLDNSQEYIYSASHERRHDLNIVINSHFAKRWTIGAQFVLASGLPYTKAEEAYILNGKMICKYSTFNGAHMKLYNRLDLSCSYDIIKKNGHEFGINLSAYNVYCRKNHQFVVYRENLKPTFGTSLSTIIPSISIYGKF